MRVSCGEDGVVENGRSRYVSSFAGTGRRPFDGVDRAVGAALRFSAHCIFFLMNSLNL